MDGDSGLLTAEEGEGCVVNDHDHTELCRQVDGDSGLLTTGEGECCVVNDHDHTAFRRQVDGDSGLLTVEEDLDPHSRPLFWLPAAVLALGFHLPIVEARGLARG